METPLEGMNVGGIWINNRKAVIIINYYSIFKWSKEEEEEKETVSSPGSIRAITTRLLKSIQKRLSPSAASNEDCTTPVEIRQHIKRDTRQFKNNKFNREKKRNEQVQHNVWTFVVLQKFLEKKYQPPEVVC